MQNLKLKIIKLSKSILTFGLSLLSLRSGQALVELVLVMGLSTIILPALVTGLIASREGKAQQSQQVLATALLRETQEAIRSVREKGWNNLTDGIFYPVVLGNSSWGLSAGSESILGFNRQIVIASAQRNTSGQIVDSGGTTDPSTKKITSIVSWNTPFASNVSSIDYLSRTLNNSTWVQTTQAQFNTGTTSNTQVVAIGDGAVELASSASTSDYGNKFRVTATSSIGSMTTSGHKTSMRFTAQSSSSVNAIRVYLQTESGTSPSYRYGIQANSSGIPSGIFLGSGTHTATATGWRTITLTPSVSITAGNIYHIVVESVGAPSGSNFVALRRSTPQNLLYPKTNISDLQSNTLFKTSAAGSWTIQDFQPIYELDFAGAPATYEGNPYESLTEISVFGANFVGEKFIITGSNKTATQIKFWVRRVGTPAGNLSVVLWDADTNSAIEEGIIATPALSTSYIEQTYTFSTPRTLQLTKNYRIYLKSATSTSTNSYRVHRINTTNSSNYHSITYDGTNSVYTNSSNSGSSWTDTNLHWDIGGFRFTIQSSGFQTSGTYESQTFDCTIPTAPATIACNGGNAGYNYITMSATEPAGTNIQLQVAVQNAPCAGVWTYLGPDGTSGTYFDNSGGIYISQSGFPCFRFKAAFSGDGISTPTLSDVTLNYSP